MKYFWLITLLVLPSVITLFNNGKFKWISYRKKGFYEIETMQNTIRRGKHRFLQSN